MPQPKVRFGFSRQSRQRGPPHPQNHMRGARLKRCLQKEHSHSPCRTRTAPWSRRGGFCPPRKCGDGSSRCESSYRISFPFLVPRPVARHRQQQGAAAAVPGSEEAREVAFRWKGPQGIGFKSPGMQMPQLPQRTDSRELSISLFLGKREVGVCFNWRNILSREDT